MANRSDFNSNFPRKYKRMLALRSSGDAHRDGELRRIFIAMHKHERDVKYGRIARTDVMPQVKDEPEASPPAA